MPTPARFIGMIALGLLPALVQAEDYNDWYQVEVVIFANQSPVSTDEIWPLAPLQYPEDMLTIAPENPADYSPLSLAQAEEVQAFEAMFDGSGLTDPDLQPAGEFLFESRSRFQTPVAPVPRTTPPAASEEVNLDGTLTPLDMPIDYDALFQVDTPVPYQALPETQHILAGQARSIRRSSLYTPLVHASWVQPIGSEAEALPILFQAGQHHDELYELDGTITISRSRFLHVETNLWYTEFTPLYDATDMNTLRTVSQIPPELRQQYPEIAEWEADRGQYTAVHTHQLKQSRRMRSATLHYIDHPRFGMLIRVERFDWSPEG